MNRLGQLPVETITLIVKQVDEDDLYTCALINRLFYTTTNPLLWETPNLDDEFVFTKVITGLFESPSLGRFIRHVEIGFPMNDAYFLLFMKFVPLVEKLALREGVSITDLSFQYLPRICPHLTRIHIEDSPVTEQSIFTMAKQYPQLEGLHVVECPLVASCFSALAACRSLEELSIDVGALTDVEEPGVSNKLVLDLVAIQGLKRLTLNECPSDFSRRFLDMDNKVAWPDLIELSLDRCSNINNKLAIGFIKTHTRLEFLSLRSSRFTDAVLDAMSMHLPGLRALDMSDNASITPQGVRRMIRKCPELKMLVVQDCRLKAKAFPEADEIKCLDDDDDLDDDDMPMYLFRLDQDAIGQIRRGS